MQPRIAILGAGGIGGSIGAYLIRAGHDVTLIDQWADHIEAIRRNGLTLTDLNQRFTVPARALHLSDVSGLREAFDVVFLSVKAYDTVWATHLIAPYLKPSGCILPAMNALNDEMIAQIVGYARVVGCVPTISAGVYDPGHVVRTDPITIHAFTVGELSGLVTPRVRWAVGALSVIGPSDPTANIWGARWAKMIWNCMGNALAGLFGQAQLTPEQQETRGLISVVIGREAARVAQALGVTLESVNDVPLGDFAQATTPEQVRAMKLRYDFAQGQRKLTAEQIAWLGAPGRPSLLQDVIKRRRTEVEYLNGAIAAKGRELGIPTPMNQAVTEVTLEVELGRAEPGADLLARLEPYLGL